MVISFHKIQSIPRDVLLLRQILARNCAVIKSPKYKVFICRTDVSCYGGWVFKRQAADPDGKGGMWTTLAFNTVLLLALFTYWLKDRYETTVQIIVLAKRPKHINIAWRSTISVDAVHRLAKQNTLHVMVGNYAPFRILLFILISNWRLSIIVVDVLAKGVSYGEPFQNLWCYSSYKIYPTSTREYLQ